MLKGLLHRPEVGCCGTCLGARGLAEVQPKHIAELMERSEAGAPLPYVQDQVGHEDIKTTQEIYVRVLRRQQRAHVGAAFNELVYGARELAFRADRSVTSDAGRKLLMASPFDAAVEDSEPLAELFRLRPMSRDM